MMGFGKTRKERTRFASTHPTKSSILATFRRPDGLPDAEGCRRHVDMTDAVFRERIDDGVHDRGERACTSGLAAALDAKRIGGRRHFVIGGYEFRRVVRARHSVIHIGP